MKKSISLLLCVLAGIFTVNAQNVFPVAANTNVGIGTTTPAAPLHIFRTGQTIQLGTGTNTSGYSLTVGVNDDGVNFSNNSTARGFNFSNAGGSLLRILANGNVGIGMIPNGRLDVDYLPGYNTATFRGSKWATVFNYGVGSSENVYIRGGKDGADVYINDQTGNGSVVLGHAGSSVIVGGNQTVAGSLSVTGDLSMSGASTINSPTNLYLAGGNMRIMLANSGTLAKQTFSYSASSPATGIIGGVYEFITGGGYVKIGSVTTPNPAGYKLYVDQGILTEKVKVAVAGSSQWADYVFQSDYKLMPLREVEAFVNNNGHLPGIPSAAEMVKEGNDLGKTDAKLLEKIEELTLYMISLKKENDRLADLTGKLQQEINTIKNKK